MRFTKMHGAGNDFIILNNMDGAIAEENYSALAAALCRRRLSIGADGLMIVVPATQARADAGDELLRLEGLGDVVIRAGLKAQHDVDGVRLRGKHDDRH